MVPKPTTRSLSACRVGAGFDDALDVLRKRRERLQLIRERTTLVAPIVQFVVLFLSIGLSLIALLNSPKVMHDVTIISSAFEVELFIVLVLVTVQPTGCFIFTAFANILILWAYETLFALYLLFVDFPKKCEENGCTMIHGHFFHRLFVIVLNVAFAITHLILGVVYGIASGSLDREKTVRAEIELKMELKEKRRRYRRYCRRERKRQSCRLRSMSRRSKSTDSESSSDTDSELRTAKSNLIENAEITKVIEPVPEITLPVKSEIPEALQQDRDSVSIPRESVPIRLPRYIKAIPTSSVAPLTDGYFVPKSEVTPQRPIFLDNEMENLPARGYDSSTDSTYRHPF